MVFMINLVIYIVIKPFTVMIVTVMINYVLLSCEYNDIDNKITRL